MTDDSEVIRMRPFRSRLRVVRRHVDLLRVSSALCPVPRTAF